MVRVGKLSKTSKLHLANKQNLHSSWIVFKSTQNSFYCAKVCQKPELLLLTFAAENEYNEKWE